MKNIVKTMQRPLIKTQKTKTVLSEQELVTRLQSNEMKALETLYENYKGAIFGCILRLVKEKAAAEEILQDVFVNIWQNIGQYDSSKGRLFTWMLRIARNLAIDRLRSKEWKIKALQLEGSKMDWHHLSEQLSHYLQTDVIGLDHLLNYLNVNQQKVMQLIYLQGYTHREAATACDLPLGTVKTLIRSGLQTLRKILRNFEKEDLGFG